MDGWLAPGGETITSLQNDLGDFMADAKPATPEQVDDHHDRLDRGEDGALNLKRHDFQLKARGDLPELSAESEASNHRLAQAIHRSGDLGQVPTYIADAAQTDGAKAIAEAHDLMSRLGPERGRDLAQAVVDRLPPEHQQAFVGGPVSERQPLGVGYDMLHKPTEEDIKKNPQLAGGLIGDDVPASSLGGDSGEDKLDSHRTIWDRLNESKERADIDLRLRTLKPDDIQQMSPEELNVMAAHIGSDDKKVAEHRDSLVKIYQAMETDPEFKAADDKRQGAIAEKMSGDPAIQKVQGGRWKTATDDERKAAMQAVADAVGEVYGVEGLREKVDFVSEKPVSTNGTVNGRFDEKASASKSTPTRRPGNRACRPSASISWVPEWKKPPTPYNGT